MEIMLIDQCYFTEDVVLGGDYTAYNLMIQG